MEDEETSQVEPRLVEVFRKFFSLLGVQPTQLKGEEEGLIDLLGLARRKFEHSSKSEREVFQWLFRRWQKYFVEEAQWREGEIILRGLFVEEMKWDELCSLFRKRESELRSSAWWTLVRLVEFRDIENRPTRDCARNDLYLLDLLSRQNWKDSLALNRPRDLETHIENCTRCRSLYGLSREWVEQSGGKSKRELSLSILEELVDERHHLGSTSELFVKSFVGVAAMVGVVLLVPYMPKLKDYVVVQIRELSEEGTIDITVSDNIEEVLDEVVRREDSKVEEAPVRVNDNPEPPSTGDKLAEKPISDEEPEPRTEEKSIFSKNYVLLPEDWEALPSPQKESPEDKAEASQVAKNSKSEGKSEKNVESAKEDQITKVFFRWGARAQDPERSREKVLEILANFKAKNISELELGALYKGGQYFHFTAQKSDYTKLLNEIRSMPFTEFTVSEASGSRKISADRSRIVFWIGPSK